MLKQVILVLALAAVLALPFALRPKQSAQAGAEATLVIITPHNEALRSEFGQAFREWYRKRSGKTVTVDWRVIGGTAEITRYLEGEYVSAFEYYWTRTLHKPWNLEVQAGFQNGRLRADAPALVKEAREAFLHSDVSCGIDLFFGGGPYDFTRQAQAGRIVDSGVLSKHPEWFTDSTIPHEFAGEEYWDRQGRWIGTVLSSYGILYNVDSYARLKIPHAPRQWQDLKDPRLVGEIALADPTKSSSIAKAFEDLIQQQMQVRWKKLRDANGGKSDPNAEATAVKEGWIDGLRLLQLIGANSRYFTDSSQKPPIDVAQGNSAAGICIDFYGRQQQEAVWRREHSKRIAYVAPLGGTVSSVDPVALLRGAKNKEVALAFIEFVLSLDGQKLWNFSPGSPGGPERFALRRMSVRRDFYEHAEFRPYLTDPDETPFTSTEQLIYRPAWTSEQFREMAFIIRVMCMDTHEELVPAWRAIIAAGFPPDAMAALQDLSAVTMERVNGPIHQALVSKDKADELRLAQSLGETFRRNYREAERLAKAAGERR